MGILNRDDADAAQATPRKFREAVQYVERQYDDRWPARGKANTRSGDYRPLEDVSREGRREAYRKWPNAAR